MANAAAPVAAREATQATLDVRSSGRAVIRFALNGEGRVTELALVNPSGIPAFDTKVLAMIQRSRLRNAEFHNPGDLSPERLNRLT